jgi:hypothetical protein
LNFRARRTVHKHLLRNFAQRGLKINC